MNTFRMIIGSLAGIILVVAVAVGTAFFTGQQSSEQQTATVASRAPDRAAPTASNNPMSPVVPKEASRRSELHNRMAEEQAAAAAAVGGKTSDYVAPPVVTEIRSSVGDDALTRAIFEDKIEVEKPEPKPEVKVEPTPKKEPEVVAEKKPEVPGYFDYYDQYRDRLRVKMDNNTPDYRVIRVRKAGQKHSSLLNKVLDYIGSSIVGTAHAADPVGSFPPRPNMYGDGSYGEVIGWGLPISMVHQTRTNAAQHAQHWSE